MTEKTYEEVCAELDEANASALGAKFIAALYKAHKSYAAKGPLRYVSPFKLEALQQAILRAREAELWLIAVREVDNDRRGEPPTAAPSPRDEPPSPRDK